MTKLFLKGGFSLIEVTLSIGIIGFALLAIVGLIPVGLKSGRESIDATRTSLIAQDAINRIRARFASNDSTNTQSFFGPDGPGFSSFFFYDSQGVATGELIRVQSPSDEPLYYSNIKNPSDFYRVKATISVFDQSGNYPSYDPRFLPAGGTPTLLCGTLEVAWPITPDKGSVPVGRNKETVTQTFFLRRP